jgi:hypothetical protein
MNKFILLAFITTAFACSPSNRITVTNVNDLAVFGKNSHMYSLPLTRVAIDITAVRHLTIPGPYNAYAQKYMGFDGVPSISKTDWEVSDIRLNTIEEPDPEYCFSLQDDQHGKTMEQLEKLSSNGLIISPFDYHSFSRFYPIFDDKPEPLHFTDLSVKGNIEKDTHNPKEKKDIVDTGTDYTSGKNKEGLKSLEQNAEEAANFIIKLRKRRFKLLAGMNTISVDKLSSETSIRELNALEEEYLSLFIGKTYTDTLMKTFIFNPKTNQDIERDVICRFSDETGFQDAMSASGMPMVLEMKNMHVTETINDPQMPSPGPAYTDILLYRIPDKASVRVFYGSSTIMEGEIEIFQYGPLVPYSINSEDR